MTLSLLLAAVAVLGLFGAMWVQVRAMRGDAAAFRRARRRSGLALLGLLLGIGLVHALATGTLRPRLFVPEEDGSWSIVSVDGRPVPGGAYTIGITDGKVSGGRDDCNYWGFSEPADASGERMIETTLAGCPEDDPVRKAYWALATAPAVRIELRPGGWLRIAARGHEAMLRRCEWMEAPLPEGTSGTGPQACVVR